MLGGDVWTGLDQRRRAVGRKFGADHLKQLELDMPPGIKNGVPAWAEETFEPAVADQKRALVIVHDNPVEWPNQH
jgi:hypothetical protein